MDVVPLPRVAALAAAVGAGLALLFAFPPYDRWWLAPLAVALLAVAAHGRGWWAGAGLGMLSGLVFFVPLLSWTALHLEVTPWLLLSVTEALYLGLLGGAAAVVTPLVRRHRAVVWPVVTALLWVGQEALRGRTPFGGFPWGRLAFSQADSPLLRLAGLGGAPLVTFAVALAGGAVAAAAWRLYEGRSRPAVRTAAGLVAGAVAVVLAGFAVPPTRPAGDTVTVALVQGNVPRIGFDFNAPRRAVLDNHVNATIRLADQVAAGQRPRPDLVVWPENASDIDPLRNPDAAARIDQAARAIGVPILVGAVLVGTGEPDGEAETEPGVGKVRNAGIVWSPDGGPGEMYVKRRPVPFAEYMPWRAVVMPIARMITDEASLLRNDFAPGDRAGVLRLGPALVGDVICFEVAYDDLVRDTVAAGAGLLAVQTNNATFNAAEARQQLAMVRLRAVEHGREGLMVSTVGVSGFVATDGTVTGATGFNTEAVVVADVRLGAGRTLATRLGVWPEVVLTLLALGAVGGAVAVRRRAGPGR